MQAKVLKFIISAFLVADKILKCTKMVALLEIRSIDEFQFEFIRRLPSIFTR